MLKDKIIIFYYKWIKRECPHFCKLCKIRTIFGRDCYEELCNDIRDEITKKKLGYYEQSFYKLIWLIIKEKIRGDR